MTDIGATAFMKWDTGPETVQEIEGSQETEETGLTVGEDLTEISETDHRAETETENRGMKTEADPEIGKTDKTEREAAALSTIGTFTMGNSMLTTEPLNILRRRRVTQRRRHSHPNI